MSTQPQPDQRPEQQPEALFTPETQALSAPSTKAEIETAVERFWEIVRKSADVIVTLRQENTMLNAQNQALRRSEQELQSSVDELLLRITTLEDQLAAVPVADNGVNQESVLQAEALLADMQRNIDRAEDELRSTRETLELQSEELTRRTELIQQRDAELASMQARLSETEQQLQEAYLHLADNIEIQKQLVAVKIELEAREQQFQELQESFSEAHQTTPERKALETRLRELELASTAYDESKMRIAELEDEIVDLRQQLEQAITRGNQLTLFTPSVDVSPSAGEGQAIRQLMTEEELTALAERLDNVADRVAQLLGIS